MHTGRGRCLAGSMVLGLLAWMGAGCDIGSDDVVRGVDIQVAGRYSAPDGGRLVSGNSGSRITRLDLQQQGERLQGVDNNGTLYTGTVRRVEAGAASIRLEGATTAGSAFTLTGSIQVTGTTATLNGTWIEADRNGGVSGKANVAAVPDPTPNPTPNPTPTPNPANPAT